MKGIIIFFSLLLCLLTGQAQDNDLPPSLQDTSYTKTSFELSGDEPARRFNFQLETGFSLGTFGNGHSLTSSYLIPTAQFNVSPKISLSLGAYISDNKWIGNSDIYSGRLIDNGYHYPSFSSGLFMAEGEYEVLPWLSLNGSYLNNATGNNDLFNAYSNIHNMMGVGVDFKISPGLSIGARFYKTNYQYNPFYSPSGLSSPFSPGW